MRSLFTAKAPHKLHILRSESEDSSTPVLFCPGFLGTAEHYKDEIEHLKNHRVAAFSFRGRGQSAKPGQGNYSLQQQAEDIQFVMDELGWDHVILIAHSRSVPLAIWHTLEKPKSVKALLLMDFPASYTQPSKPWLDKMLEIKPADTTNEVLHALYNDAKPVTLWGRLKDIECPTQIVRGGTDGSLLSFPEGNTYVNLLQQGTEVVFSSSGHELDKPDEARYFQMLFEFVEKNK